MKSLACLIFGSLATAVAPAAEDAPDFIAWHTYEEPAFPAQLHGTVVRDGFATLVFTFDDAGNLTDRIVLAASHPAFSGAVLQAASRWRIDPLGLSPFARREIVRFDFQRSRSIITLTQRDASKSAFSPYGDDVATAVRTYREPDMTERLRATTQVNPEYPPALKAKGIRGMATVSFIVDAEGRVRVPAITHATENEFGAAALAAIKTWRFSPPRHNGVPAQAMAERTLVFSARTEPEKGK